MAKVSRAVCLLKPNKSTVRVAPPADVIINQSSDSAVVMIATSDTYTAQAAITAPAARAYAKRIGADFHLLTGDEYPHWPMANKYRVVPIAKQYERTLLIDCDVFIRPNAPNIFHHVPAESLGVLDETMLLKLFSGLTWIEREGRHVCQSQGVECPSDWRMYNAGVLVLSKQNANLYEPPSQPIPTYWCAEQQWLTIRSQLENAAVTHLDHRFNWTFVRQDYWQRMSEAWFIHCNGARPNSYLCEILRRISEGNFSRLDPPPKSPWRPEWIGG